MERRQTSAIVKIRAHVSRIALESSTTKEHVADFNDPDSTLCPLMMTDGFARLSFFGGGKCFGPFHLVTVPPPPASTSYDRTVSISRNVLVFNKISVRQLFLGFPHMFSRPPPPVSP